MKILALVVIGLLMVGIAEAGIFEDAVNYIKERPMKVGVSYDLDGKDALSTIGTKLAEVSKFDVDLLVSGTGLDLFNDNDVIVSSGVSYNVPITTNTKLSLGASIGVKRFESFKNGETGEAKILINALCSIKF